MAQLPLTLSEAPQPRRRGRPPGAKNRRSIDLARYIEAQFGGTPGQQVAQLGMVTPAEVKRARKEAEELGLTDLGLGLLELAQVVKAEKLAKALGISRAEAWAAGHKAREALLPYVHQRQPQAAESKGKAPATVFLIPEAEAHQLPDFSVDDDADEGVEILEDLGTGGREVGRPQSDD